MKKILITGGAGFIGRHLCKKLSNKSFEIIVLDSFNPQVHSSSSLNDFKRDYPEIKIIPENILACSELPSLLKNTNILIHLAAETGTGQSMYEINRYSEVNILGTSKIIQCLVEDKSNQLEKVILSSSRSVYGEGAYFCKTHGRIYPHQRKVSDLRDKIYEPYCGICENIVEPVATLENDPRNYLSYYAFTKGAQEDMFRLFANTYEIPFFGLRFQNVYGPGQSLKNPYTGILAVFSNLARINKEINIFEDGKESRDFVYIDDVIDAIFNAVRYENFFSGYINVGSGIPTSVNQVSKSIVSYFNSSSAQKISNAFRVGDIRHNFADISLLQSILKITPKVSFEKGLENFLEWSLSFPVTDSGAYEKSLDEIKNLSLFIENQ